MGEAGVCRNNDLHALVAAWPAAARELNEMSDPICLLRGELLPDVVHGSGPLARLMRTQGLHAVFQPIADLKDGAIHAHEALIRGPADSALHGAETLLLAAQAEGLLYELEFFCIYTALKQWGQLRQPGRLFLNISANALVQLVQLGGCACFSKCVRDLGVSPRMVVLEITEHERASDMQALVDVVQQLRNAGLALALDDFGDGRSSLRLWSQIKPDLVKIDKYFSRNISGHADNLKTLQALMQIADIFGTALVAEGIENAEDLRVLRDLGLAYGQGYFIGRPAQAVLPTVRSDAVEVLQDSRVAVMPEQRHISRMGHLRHLSLIHAPCVSPTTSNDEVATLLLARPELHALAVVDGGRPVAIINRQLFMDHYATMYFREIFGKKSCLQYANPQPRLIERNHDIDELIGILTSQDQRYLSDGFIVTENGRYVGLGTGDQLVRSVTELRLEAARHANPLTFLPGNIPISLHIKRLLDGKAPFVACYLDMNNFKPFNDHYGYWRGDEMIRLLARLAVAHSDPQRDFVGHVGGDDFLILFQSEDWRQRCELIVSEFAHKARDLFDEAGRLCGGIHAEDRHGVMRFYPCTTLSIGAVQVGPPALRDAEDVATQAALAKHEAKMKGGGLYVRADRDVMVA
jgi:EAL domain-containing protein (putative c-di-GMP-specific phosphodiesterase class I)/GGDEF domain-containing protein